MEARALACHAGSRGRQSSIIVVVECSLCDLAALEVLFEDARAAIVLHDDWAIAGHVMVVWKAHVENIADLSEDEWMQFARLYQRTEERLLSVTGADRAIMMKLGIATPHLHLHIYPVSAALDRVAVMQIIDARTRISRDEEFVNRLREALR